MTNNEMFNRTLNACSDPWEISSLLMAFFTPEDGQEPGRMEKDLQQFRQIEQKITNKAAVAAGLAALDGQRRRKNYETED